MTNKILCDVCQQKKSLFKKQRISNWHYSGDLQINYAPFYICDSESCFDVWMTISRDDKKLYKKLHRL